MRAPSTHRAPETRRERAPYDGPRVHRIAVETNEPGVSHVVRQSIAGQDDVVIAWLRALADHLERGNQ